MTPALVTELKRLDAKASPAPWLVAHCDYAPGTIHDDALIAALRNAAPALLEAVETMHAALEIISRSRWTVSSQSTGAIQSGPSGEAIDAQEALARVAALLGEGQNEPK